MRDTARQHTQTGYDTPSQSEEHARMNDSSSPRRVATRSVVLAAMALPGVWATTAHAENAPEKGLIGLKYLRYQDEQTGLKRITWCHFHPSGPSKAQAWWTPSQVQHLANTPPSRAQA
jgi:hypothetical protein